MNIRLRASNLTVEFATPLQISVLKNYFTSTFTKIYFSSASVKIEVLVFTFTKVKNLSALLSYRCSTVQIKKNNLGGILDCWTNFL